MAATPFRAVNWSPNELIGEDKMDQMSANMNWLRDNTPRAVYTLPGGTQRVEGVRVVSGKVVIGARKTDTAEATVRFGNFFSTQCQPVITTGIVSGNTRKLFVVYKGIGQLQPDHRGFEVMVKSDNGTAKREASIPNTFYVAWTALGY